MASLKIYKDFYVIIHNSSINSDDYNLIDPFNLTAEVKEEGGNEVIEVVNVNKESLGKYYVNLNVELYSFDKNYEIFWNVVYIENAPLKKLITRFNFYPIVIGDKIELEVMYL